MQTKVSKQLQENIDYLEQRFKDCDDLIKKRFFIGREKGQEAYFIYADGLVDNIMIQEDILRPLMIENLENYPECLLTGVLESADRMEIKEMETCITQILSGNTVLFFSNCSFAIMVSSKKFPNRGIQAPEEEVSIRGAKDSFNESLRFGTALIRRRIRDTRLKVKQVQVGVRSKTDVALMYMEDLVKEETLAQIQEELDRICVDGILDSGMLEQFLEKRIWSPFPQYQHTQRPDKVSSGILEGRVALVVDNSPDVLLLPVTFSLFFQAGDDYYNRFEVASFARILRYLAVVICVGLPGFYVAVADFHTEVIPTNLILSFAKARQDIPFPVVVEVLLMEFSFELLREAGIRLPLQLGGTIGIVGGLIVGQTAVEAGIVSTIVVIVVSFTAIASFCIPSESLRGSFRLLKFAFLIASAFWGIYGLFLAFLATVIHLCSLESYGIAYLSPLVDGGRRGDHIIRAPWKYLKIRPKFTKEGARRRQKR